MPFLCRTKEHPIRHAEKHIYILGMEFLFYVLVEKQIVNI